MVLKSWFSERNAKDNPPSEARSFITSSMGMAASKDRCHHCTMMKKATQRIACGVVRGTVAALAMIGGMRQATTGLGFVER